jgi:hypothetical protein
MLAALTGSETDTLFLILAILGFAVALYLAYVRNYVGAVIAAFIAVVILAVAL